MCPAGEPTSKYRQLWSIMNRIVSRGGGLVRSGERPKISPGPVRPSETGSDELGHRRLAAVAFVDIVGYTILMANDETRTNQRWMRILREVISPQAEKFRGTVVKSTGDGVLVEFPSAHDAVDWARQV